MTSYSRDMCYAYDWTLEDKPTYSQSYQWYQKTVQNMALDDIGLGITMCEMARASSGDLVMFNRAGKCFNGRNYVQNQLERHLRLQKRWISNQLKFMTYFETCVNHRNGIMSGTPIDDLLSDYLKEALQLEDTITVIVSDHGNGMADLVLNQFPFGHIQRFHPFLIVIPPANWTHYFTREEMDNLKINQRRLVTMRELHFLVSKFTMPDRRDENGGLGILSEISEDRTCLDIDFFDKHSGQFDMCICEWVSSTPTASELADLKEAAEVYLNSLNSAYRRCCRMFTLRPLDPNLFIRTQQSGTIVHYTGIVSVDNDWDLFHRNIVISLSVHFNTTAGGSLAKSIKQNATGPYKFVGHSRLDVYARFERCFMACRPADRTTCLC
ncbi:uncharacterized protein LOC142358339 [Convolutriloba macropyga]|uniref:uncharacterized protein LOC142358339 n=1 Tax=Convolutriloba macropyga TaxID=536237 RepID=UPI003F528AA5